MKILKGIFRYDQLNDFGTNHSQIYVMAENFKIENPGFDFIIESKRTPNMNYVILKIRGEVDDIDAAKILKTVLIDEIKTLAFLPQARKINYEE